MILEPLSFLAALSPLHRHFLKAFDFLSTVEQEGFPEGVFPIDADELIASVETVSGKGKKNARLEAHKRYIDIHYVLSGEDLIGWKPFEACQTIAEEYHSEKDKLFFQDSPEGWFTLKPGYFALFFPHDAHAPLAGKKPVKKVILKVKL